MLLICSPRGLFADAANSGQLTPTQLRCEYQKNPLGIDITEPRLSWVVQPTAVQSRGLRQTRYRILVASTLERLDQDMGDLWDSGEVESAETLNVEYRGAPLRPRMHCHWKVQVWDQDRRASDWSASALWTMGLLSDTNWQAKWISAPLRDPVRSPHLGYRSLRAQSEYDPKWVQIDLGATTIVDGVRVWGTWPVKRNGVPGEGFPVRFKIETATNANWSDAKVVVDRTGEDTPNPALRPLQFDFPPTPARFVRLTATRLSGSWVGAWDPVAEKWTPRPANADWILMLAELEVLGGGKNLALGKAVSALDSWNDDSADMVPAARVAPKPGTVTQGSVFGFGHEPAMRGAWKPANLTDGRVEADFGSRYDVRPVTLFRREFNVQRVVRRATLFATALGAYQLRLNGSRVGNEELAPGWTIYPKRVLYQTHDVTPQIRSGANAVVAELADGWYRMRGWLDVFGGNRRVAGYWYEGDRSLLAQLEIEFEDGSHEVIGTDSSWQSFEDGPLRRASIYDGVYYDARKEVPGWDDASPFEMRGWQAAATKPLAGGPKISAQMFPPIRVRRELRPISRTEPRSGAYVFDFGEQVAGVCRLRVKGESGAAVKIRHAEALKPDGTLYVGNLGGAYDNHDLYILDGSGSRTFVPSFTYHGFRYVEVSGPTGPEEIEELTALEMGSDLPQAAWLSSSDVRLNRLCAIMDRANRSNFFSLAVDVAGRDERLPWMGDCYTTAVQSLAYMYDFAAFASNQHQAIADALNSGGVPPPLLVRVQAENDYAAAGWCDASVTAPYYQWVNFGDRRSLRLGYEGAKRFMDTIARENEDGVPRKMYFSRWGDWLSARMTIPPGAGAWRPKGGKGAPNDLFAASWWAFSAELVSRMAAALGQAEEAKQYAGLAAKIRSALVHDHVQPDGTASGGEQSSYALLLGMNHLTGALRDRAQLRLMEAIRAYDRHLATGSVTTLFLGCPGFLVAARGTEQIRQEAEFAAVKEDARPIVGEAAEAPRV